MFNLALNASTLEQDTVTLLFTGDIMQHMPQINAAYEKGGTYNYDPCFQYVKDEISKADVAIGNLEVPLAGKPYSGYPQFSAPDEIAFALKKAGFDIMVTANNHSCDRHSKGIKGTIKALDSAGFQHTGIFLDAAEKEKKYPLFFESKNIRFALLNYTYGTNGLPVPPPHIVNLIDTVQIFTDIEKAKKGSPDLIIAFLHWGNEYQRLPNTEQKKLADFLIRNGVQLIIGAHPHVMQPMEKRYDERGYTSAAIVYSLGNYVSNQSQPNTDGGAMARIKVVKDADGVRIRSCAYSLVWVYRPIVDGKTRYYILPAAEYQNKTDFMDETHKNKLNLFMKNSRELFNLHNVGFMEYKF